MSSVSITFTSSSEGFILPGRAGQAVQAVLPAGCVLMVSDDLQSWAQETTTVPFVCSAELRHYRIDCVTYTSPATATLTIQ